MFVKVTASGPRRYVQLVESYRDDAGRVKKRTVATLGRLDQLTGELDSVIDGLLKVAGREPVVAQSAATPGGVGAAVLFESARALGNVVPCQPRQYERGGRGVAYAHFAKHDGVAWQRLHQFLPVLQRLLALRGSHGGLLGAVGRAVGYFAQAQFGVGLEVVRYAAIGHGHVDVVLAGKYAYSGAARQKVFNHLPGYVLRHAGYAVAHQPVVARADEYLRLLQHGVGALQNHADLHRQRFKPRQRALRLGFVVDDGLQLGLQCGVLKVGNGGEVHGFLGGWWREYGGRTQRAQRLRKRCKKIQKRWFFWLGW